MDTTNTTTEDCGCNGSSTIKTPEPTILSKIINKVFVSESTKNHRLSICKTCDHFDSTFTRCKLCGCFLEAKTRLQGFHCALDQIGETPLW